LWHIATFGFSAKIGRYRGKADIKKISRRPCFLCVSRRATKFRLFDERSPGLTAVFRALGGGWQIRVDGNFVTAATIEQMRAY